MKILTVSSFALLMAIMQNSAKEHDIAGPSKGEFSYNAPVQYQESPVTESLPCGSPVLNINNGSKMIRYIFY